METALDVFDETLKWIGENYSKFTFFVERDVVWTFQNKVQQLISENNLPLKVFNNYPILKGKRQGLSADIVILNEDNKVELAIEFKYEPDHKRGKEPNQNIWPTKLDPSVVFWGKQGVLKDVERCEEFISKGVATAAVTIFIDEGRLFRHRNPHPRTKWIDWGSNDKQKISVLIGRFGDL
ncbi:MAG: hypothetical protein SVM80_03085 [Halobacteriota archaeon]|nr:hypothetical protein [Halobacteriota archaeon]